MIIFQHKRKKLVDPKQTVTLFLPPASSLVARAWEFLSFYLASFSLNGRHCLGPLSSFLTPYLPFYRLLFWTLETSSLFFFGIFHNVHYHHFDRLGVCSPLSLQSC